MTYRIVTGPASEPLKLAEACEWLKLSVGDDDNVVNMLIKAARFRAEQETGRDLLTKTVEQYFDRFPDSRTIEFGRNPVSSATVTLSYLAASGTTYTMFDNTKYTVDRYSSPARIVLNELQTWPTAVDDANAIKIAYSVGVATSADVMENIKLGMLTLIAFWYENREDMPIGSNPPGYVKRTADALFFSAKTFF